MQFEWRCGSHLAFAAVFVRPSVVVVTTAGHPCFSFASRFVVAASQSLSFVVSQSTCVGPQDGRGHTQVPPPASPCLCLACTFVGVCLSLAVSASVSLFVPALLLQLLPSRNAIFIVAAFCPPTPESCNMYHSRHLRVLIISFIYIIVLEYRL